MMKHPVQRIATFTLFATLACSLAPRFLQPVPTDPSTTPILISDFAAGQLDWWTDWTGEGAVDVSDGRLVLSTRGVGSTAIAGHPDLKHLPGAYRIDISLRQVKGSGTSHFAIAFRNSDPENLATIYISGNGSIALGVTLDGAYQEIIPWSHQTDPLSDATIISFIDRGQTVELHVGSELVLLVPFEYLRPGEVYFYLGTYDTAEAVWEIDAVSVTALAD